MRTPSKLRGQIGALALLVAGISASQACADEIRLKDGKKLYGVIVAYEDNMFKVKTDFGYVLVEKDKILSIIPDTPTDGAGPKPTEGQVAAGNPAEPSAAEAGGNVANPSAKPSSAPVAAKR